MLRKACRKKLCVSFGSLNRPHRKAEPRVPQNATAGYPANSSAEIMLARIHAMTAFF